MTATPFHDIAEQARASALKGAPFALTREHAIAIATDPDVQALLAAKAAAETGRLLRAEPQLRLEPQIELAAVLAHYVSAHSRHTAAPERSAYAVAALNSWGRQQPAAPTIADLGREFVVAYTAWRRATVADSTIRRELATLRAALGIAADDQLISYKPVVPKISGEKGLKTRGRQLSYGLPQLAAILEAAWRVDSRQHVHLFVVAMLASHSRAEAVLECDLDVQHSDGVIDWLGPIREQTKKRRAMVPVAPTLASWLEGRRGKLIRYRVARRRRPGELPGFYERDTASIAAAFEGTLLAAGAAHPSLKLRVPAVDAGGRVVVVDGEPVWTGVGSPNTIRHTIHTQLRRIGVPAGQIAAAAGHVEQGNGRHYDHLDAMTDLRDFVAGVEQLFDELRAYTGVHRRGFVAQNVFDFGAARRL
ncbi:MAG: hypothetical protein ACRYG4_04295 [Janthinobacterium lividum]